MEYGKNYEQYLEPTNILHRWFIGLLTRKAEALGQKSHKMWSLRYVLENYLQGRENLRVMDLGAWNGWFLSYESPAIAEKIALDFDAFHAAELREKGIVFVLADMEKGRLPFRDESVDLVSMTSTLEHLANPERVVADVRRILRPDGVVFITVPNIMKYKFDFWDDITHKRPFNAKSLRFVFEANGIETLELCPYNHNLFIAGNLFPKALHRFLTRLRGKALMYVGRKPPK